MHMTDDHEFLTIAEAAAFLRVSETSLRRWTNSGKLRCFRVGGRNERRFLKQDLLTFMPPADDRATVPPTAASSDTRERHVCLLFHAPEEQWQLLRPYLLAHLRADAPVLYMHDSTLPERLVERLRAEGLAIDDLLAGGLLRILPPAQSYLLAGRFDPQRMLAFMESAILAGLAAGHGRVFLTGEMTWSLANAPGAERMMTYEALLNPLVEKYPAVTIVCQYDLQRFNAASVLDVLLTHSSAQLASGLVDGFYRQVRDTI
jgi:excisionase family DNA binding protein